MPWPIGCGNGGVRVSGGSGGGGQRRRIAPTVALVILLASLVGRGEAAWGPPLPHVLTLEDTLRIAFVGNVDMKVDRVAKAKSAEKVEESRRSLLPKLDLLPTVSYFNRSDVFGDSVAASIAFPSGVATGASLSFTPELFSYPRLAKVLESDVFRVAKADWDIQDTWRSVKFNVIQAFHQVLVNRELFRISESSREVARRQLERSRALFNQGKIARLEVTRSELTLAQQEADVIRARNNLAKSKTDLLKLLGAEGGSEVEILGDFLILPIEGTPADLQALALERRPDLRRLEVQRAVSEKTVLVEQASESTTPTVSFFANYTFANLSSATVSGNLESYSVGLLMTIPLPIWGRRTAESRVAQAKLAVIEDEIQIASLRRDIYLDVIQKVADMDRLQALVKASEIEVAWAQENLRTTEVSFEAGKSTTLDLANALNSFVQAETNLAQSKFDYVVGLADLDRSIGR